MLSSEVKYLLNQAIKSLTLAKTENPQLQIKSAIEDIEKSTTLITNELTDEICIVDDDNWIEQLTFTTQNSKYEINNHDRFITITTSVRASEFFITYNNTKLNTDIEIEGYLSGGRNSRLYCGDSSFPILIDSDGYFKMRMYCNGNRIGLTLVDMEIGGVETKLIINSFKIYEKRREDSELYLQKNTDIIITNLDQVLPTNWSQTIEVSSITGSLNSMKLYSYNESIISFTDSTINTKDTPGKYRIFTRNKYGLGTYADIYIIDDINFKFISEKRVIPINEQLKIEVDVSPKVFFPDTSIKASNDCIIPSFSNLIAQNIGDVDITLKTKNNRVDYSKTIPFKVVDDGTKYNNIFRMKKENLTIGDTYTTNGYYEDDDGGSATYIIVDYDTFLNSLPTDIKTINFGTGIKNTPVDEYGNHTLNNGLIAKILTTDGEPIKVEQWGCIGDGKFNNTEALIHLFAHTKTGTIQFGKNKNYVLYGRNKNIAYFYPEVYLSPSEQTKYQTCTYHQYASTMCSHITSGAFRGKPIMANIQNVILDGNNCTITIPPEEFALGSNEFGIFEFCGNVDGLEIKGFTFQQNGLNQTYYIDDNCTKLNQPTRAHTIFFSDNCTHKWSHVNIHHNKFYENGTNINISDSGGDFILVINPLESTDVYIEDNEFYDWGRWVYALDLGGNGERFYNYKFNRNKCIQTIKNRHWEIKNGIQKNQLSFRGLGWIDFEARKCFTNLEVCDNYVEGLTGFAINGNSKVTDNVILSRNKLNRKDRWYKSAYQYEIEWYSALIKNLTVEDNIGMGGKFGSTVTNASFINNNFRGLTLNKPYGSIYLQGNQITPSIVSFNNLGDYTFYDDVNRCDISLIDNIFTGNLSLYDYQNPNKFDNYSLTLENNFIINGNFAINAIGKNLQYDPIQSMNYGSAMKIIGFRLKDGTCGYSLNANSISIPYLIYKEGDIITNNLDTFHVKGSLSDLFTDESFIGYKALRCTRSGALPDTNQHRFKYNYNYKLYDLCYVDNRTYLCVKAGTSGTLDLVHTNDYVTSGSCIFLYYAPLAQYEKLTEKEVIELVGFKLGSVPDAKDRVINFDLGESISYELIIGKKPIGTINSTVSEVNDNNCIKFSKGEYVTYNSYKIEPINSGQAVFKETGDNHITTGEIQFNINSYSKTPEVTDHLFFNVTQNSDIIDNCLYNELTSDFNIYLNCNSVTKDQNGAFVLNGNDSYLKFSRHFIRELTSKKQNFYIEICFEMDEQAAVFNILTDDVSEKDYNKFIAFELSGSNRIISCMGESQYKSWNSCPILAKNQVFGMTWYDDYTVIYTQGRSRLSTSIQYKNNNSDLYIGLNSKIKIHEIKIYSTTLVDEEVKQEFYALYNKY